MKSFMNMVAGPGSLILASFLIILSISIACAPQAPAPAAPGAPKPTATAPQPRPTPGSVTAAGSGIVNSKFAGEAQALNGAGATFPAVLYSKWFNEYAKVTGVKVNYQSIGSGGGIKSISAATVDFGATDGPMTDEQIRAAKSGEILHIPAAIGAVVPTYNLPEIGSTTLKFSPESLAGIFLARSPGGTTPKSPQTTLA